MLARCTITIYTTRPNWPCSGKAGLSQVRQGPQYTVQGKEVAVEHREQISQFGWCLVLANLAVNMTIVEKVAECKQTGAVALFTYAVFHSTETAARSLHVQSTTRHPYRED
jgi:hypothetical protein